MPDLYITISNKPLIAQEKTWAVVGRTDADDPAATAKLAAVLIHAWHREHGLPHTEVPV